MSIDFLRKTCAVTPARAFNLLLGFVYGTGDVSHQIHFLSILNFDTYKVIASARNNSSYLKISWLK